MRATRGKKIALFGHPPFDSGRLIQMFFVKVTVEKGLQNVSFMYFFYVLKRIFRDPLVTVVLIINTSTKRIANGILGSDLTQFPLCC